MTSEIDISMDEKYAVLQETSDEEFETWYYFIRVKGNEDALKHLKKILDSIELERFEDISMFVLDLKHPVSYNTAKEMCCIKTNEFQQHRIFHGKLQKIDFDFIKGDDNEEKIIKVHDALAYGDFDKFIDQEETF